ncbi:MAG: lamin tail domain-containing protein, partial [Gammaproteobacteria bacterium]
EQREAVPPAEGPASGQGERVAELLSQAERQLAAKQLTTPPGDAALESYRQVLQLVPEHEVAQKGIEGITGQYQAWARRDHRRGDWDRAEAHLKTALAIAPGDPSLQAALGAIEEARSRSDERARRLASENEAIRQEREKETSGVVQAPAERGEVTLGARVQQLITRSEEKNPTMENDAVREAQASKVPALPPKPPAGRIAKSEPTATEPAVPSKLRSPVVINEFMAANQQTIANRLGGYGDWIEIYNPNAETVDLSGHYLSNDATNPEQWRFPKGTVIRGRGHLLIWADKRSGDTTPSEIHTNFDLSRMGGQIVLTDDKKKVVDSVRFGRQREDVSLGKGAGSRPTPGR